VTCWLSNASRNLVYFHRYRCLSASQHILHREVLSYRRFRRSLFMHTLCDMARVRDGLKKALVVPLSLQTCPR
jgi:hypothetical protein